MNFESKLINKKKSDVSVIIPSKDFLDSLNNTVQALLSQELLPKEIIIIDSSENGIFLTTFVVVAHTEDEDIYFVTLFFFNLIKTFVKYRNFFFFKFIKV